MAGSNRFFVYTDDEGTLWGVNRDETSTELVNGTASVGIPAANTPILVRQGFIEPRYVNYNSIDGFVRRKVVLLDNTPAALLGIPESITVPTESGTTLLYLTSYIGERRRYIPQADTGQQSGDADPPAGG